MASHGDQFNYSSYVCMWMRVTKHYLSNVDWIKANEDAVNIFVQCAFKLFTRDMANDPTIIRRETNPDGPTRERS